MKKLMNNCVRGLRQGLVMGIAIVFISCGSTKPPSEDITRAENTIKQAEQIGAQNYAPLELREARQKLERANKLVEEEKYEEAKRMADQAEIDAELAEAKTLSEKAQKAVHELRESIKALREEISSNQQNR